MLRRVPKDEPHLRKEFTQGLPNTFLDGRVLKSTLDILQHEGYVRSERVIDKPNATAYVRTEKRLEGESTYEPRVHMVPPTQQ